MSLRAQASALARVEAKVRGLEHAREQRLARAEAEILKGDATRREFEIVYADQDTVSAVADLLQSAVEQVRAGDLPTPDRRSPMLWAAQIVTSPPGGPEVADAWRQLRSWGALRGPGLGQGRDEELFHWVQANLLLIHLERNEARLRVNSE